MTTRKEYEPFGEEWNKEMHKWTKQMLIDFLKQKLIELQAVKNV